VRRDGGAPVSASTERLVASTAFIAGAMNIEMGVGFRDIDGVGMSGAVEACLPVSLSRLSRLLSFFTRRSGWKLRLWHVHPVHVHFFTYSVSINDTFVTCTVVQQHESALFGM